ncbi:MAG TPA: FecR family protein [Leptospiraceae bacterium]|nr:FecR family protein [Leptospiraceae bacterium]
MKKKYLLTILMVIVSLFSCSKPKEKDDPKIKGDLIFVIGKVEISNQNGSKEATKNMAVLEGDTIRTGEKSVAGVQFENETASIEIQENAEFTIQKFNKQEQQLVSTKGNFWIKAKKANKDTNFNVVLPTAVAGIRGTSFYSFEIKEERIHGVCHCQGAVDFQDKVTNYKGSHDTDYGVLTRDGKTITMTPEDFKSVGVNFDKFEHKHSRIDNSPLGKKSSITDEQFANLLKIAKKKFAELK